MQNASLKKLITLKSGTWQLSDILKEVQQQAGLNYKIIGDHILFMDYQAAGTNKSDAKTVVRDAPVSFLAKNTEAKKKTKISLPVIKKKGYSQITSKASPAGKGLIPNISGTTNSIGNHAEQKKEQEIISATENNAGPMFALPEHSIWTNATRRKDTSLLLLPRKDLFISFKRDTLRKKGSLLQQKDNDRSLVDKEKGEWRKVFVKAGLSADEILYMNASFMGGIKYVYGIVSYGTNFTVGRLRFGVGVPIKLNDEQQLHFNATLGILTKSRLADSLPVSAAIKEKLYRYGTAWSKTYNQRWTLQVQLHYNVLKRTFDNAHSPADDARSPTDYDHFYYGNRPYTLFRGTNSHSNTRSWIGAQVAVYYSLF
jgi:hypothetical protein